MHEENARGPHKLSTVETWEADTLKKNTTVATTSTSVWPRIANGSFCSCDASEWLIGFTRPQMDAQLNADTLSPSGIFHFASLIV